MCNFPVSKFHFAENGEKKRAPHHVGIITDRPKALRDPPIRIKQFSSRIQAWQPEEAVSDLQPPVYNRPAGCCN